ncbi:MAG: NAD(P)-binding domain-containing protein, partial [Bacteroidota bacterium]|nr:NAD(P)-binding domain-containing protein [Bacteroidota bacterium]
MELSIIGAGNVATVLGKALQQKNHTIREVYSRTITSAARLADYLGAKALTNLNQLDGRSDLYLLAVPDDVIPVLADQLQLGDRLLVHTAGSVSQTVLSGASSRFGVL